MTLQELRAKPSAWRGLEPVAKAVVDRVKPLYMVELGVYYGYSLSYLVEYAMKHEEFCYAVGVDTFEGDKHAGGVATDACAQVREALAELTPNVDIWQMTFDEAAANWAIKNTDLLHIDGLHTYEAVKHDFETWEPLVTPGGAIMLHDIAVKKDDFGVWKLWEEIKASGKYETEEVLHSNGLGILYKPEEDEGLPATQPE